MRPVQPERASPAAPGPHLYSLKPCRHVGRSGGAKAPWQSLFEQAQREQCANVVCLKWGTRYGPEWVNRLYGMVARNTTWTVRFVCFTDDPSGIRPEVECRPLPAVSHGAVTGKYWPKLG